MPIQITRQRYVRLLRGLILLVLSLMINGCDSSKPPELGTGLVFPDAGNMISLGGFWFNVEGNGVSPEDRIIPEIDPIGGYLFLYWVDDQGNACHGQPGVSGQPGAIYVDAFQQQAYDLANQKATITTTQLVEFQKIPYRVDSYVSAAQASGLHFVQYGNVMWRSRKDGSAFIYRGTVDFSIPLIISVHTTHTLFPYHPDKQNNTCTSEAVPLPSIPGTPGQDPNRCGVRAFPSAESMNYQDSLSYCLVKLPQGMTWTHWP